MLSDLISSHSISCSLFPCSDWPTQVEKVIPQQMMQLRPRVDWEADVLNRYNTLVRELTWNEDGMVL